MRKCDWRRSLTIFFLNYSQFNFNEMSRSDILMRKKWWKQLKLCVVVHLRVCLICSFHHQRSMAQYMATDQFEFECCNFIVRFLFFSVCLSVLSSNWVLRVIVLELLNVRVRLCVYESGKQLSIKIGEAIGIVRHFQYKWAASILNGLFSLLLLFMVSHMIKNYVKNCLLF